MAIFMANAGAAWDNAKKIVETKLKQKGTPLHDATVIGDTVGDPFKDTSSVAMNPVIKFTTLFGLLAVELAVSLTRDQGTNLTHILALAFFAVSVFFVYRVLLRDADFVGVTRVAREKWEKGKRHPVFTGRRFFCLLAICLCLLLRQVTG